MALPLYLALTAREFTDCSSLPAHPAWMAFHFSPYGTGLCNLPPALSEGSILILNDRIPPAGHDPESILEQLRTLDFSTLLLDFQRPGCTEISALVRFLATELGRPVGISESYARDGDGAVFLPPVPPDVAVDKYLSPWQGREIWLEAALDGLHYTITQEGSAARTLSVRPTQGLIDDALFCHYRGETLRDRVEISLWRTRSDLDALLEKAQTLGVTQAVGLWQELRGKQ